MSASKKSDNIERELLELSCPFTWELQDASKHYVVMKKKIKSVIDDLIDEEACLNLEKLITCLVILYEKVLFNEIDRATVKLEECEKLLMEMKDKQEDEDIIRVIEHIFNATKCHYLYETNNIEQVKIILPTIVRKADFNNMEEAALAGCQSIAWSLFKDFGSNKAIFFAKYAIEQNSDKALWHFILAKSIRINRRRTNFYSSPSYEEELHFKVAYEKSPNPVFGIYLVQMYRGFLRTMSWNRVKNLEQTEVKVYKEILKSSENNYKILLKLALGFINIDSSCQSELAKHCLDTVEKMEPNNSTFFHYKGLYLRKFGNFKEALEFFKRGGELSNYLADMDYIKYGWKADLVDPLNHCITMLERYDGFHEDIIQDMYLNIATCYTLKKNLSEAMKYYIKAIEVNPRCQKLKTMYRFTDFSTRGYRDGIYGFLKLAFLKMARNCSQYRDKDETFIRRYNKLEYLCNSYATGFGTHQALESEE